MSENYYGALMMRSALATTQNLKSVAEPGIYSVITGNSTAPGSQAGTLFVFLPASTLKMRFVGDDGKTYEPTSTGWQAKGTAAFCDVTVSNLDATPGRAPVVGWMGLSLAIPIPYNTDLSEYLKTSRGSFYHLDSAAGYVNAPSWFGDDWFDIVMTIHETVGARTISATSSSGKTAFAVINNNNFSGWKKNYTEMQKPTALDVGAVSTAGGEYSAKFRFGGVSTIGGSSNDASLYSATSLPNNSIASGVKANWFTHHLETGIVRDSGAGTLGFAVDIDGDRKLFVDTNGNVMAPAALYESGGKVRMYSENNPPPYPVKKVNNLTGNVVTATASLATSGWFRDEATKMMVAWGTGRIPGNTHSVTIVFPVTFLETYNVQVTNIGGGGYSYGVNAIRPGGADIYGEGISSESNFYYEARGRAS